MNRWWCMDCRAIVELDKHGRCGCCESEAVDLMEQAGILTGPVSIAHIVTESSAVCS